MELRYEVEKVVDIASESGRVLILGYAFDASNRHAIVFLRTARRYYAEAVGLFRQLFPQDYLSFGKSLNPSAIDKMVRIHDHVEMVSAEAHVFDSSKLDHKIVLRDVLAAQFPSHWYARSFFLFDIVDFSRRADAEQVTLRLLLDAAVSKAVTNLQYALASQEQLASMAFNVITTGDGCYVWHPNGGASYDLLTFALGVLTLGELRRPNLRLLRLQVRCAFVIGAAFTLAASPVIGSERSVLVRDAIGPALNKAARLCAAAAPGQVLLGHFEPTYEAPDAERWAADAFLQSVSSALMPNVISFDSSSHEKYRVIDKHGVPHYCYNVAGRSFYHDGNRRVAVPFGATPDTATDLADRHFMPL